MPKPTIATFYSFRGGVGRSMAMLNAGWLLASTGSRVLLIDFDLEAPGLTRLVHRQDLVANPEDVAQPGIADIIHQLVQSPDEWAFHDDKPLPIALSPYLIPLKVPEPRLPAIPGGEFALMTAGCDEGYGTCLASVHSPEFADLREGFAIRFRDVLSNQPFDYILVDSRTGLSDEAYIAARFLCDHLVVLSGLNDQNIEGTGLFLRYLAGWREAAQGPKGVLLVASPVPEYEDDFKGERLRLAEARLSELSDTQAEFALRLPYHPRVSLYEELVAAKWPESGLGRAYHELADILRILAEDSFGAWARRAADAVDRRNAEEALRAYRRAAAIDYEQALRLMHQAASGISDVREEEAGAVMELLAGLADLEPGQPLYPLQRARVARRSNRPQSEVLGCLADAENLARARDSLPAIAAISLERAEFLEGLDPSPACESALVAVKAYAKLGDEEFEARALLVAGHASAVLGQMAEAREHLGRAQSLLAGLATRGARLRLGAAFHELARLDLLQGSYGTAREREEQALAIARQLGARQPEAAVLHRLAELDRLQGRYDAAREGLEQALAIQRELGDRREVSVTLHSLAALDRLQGRYDAARDGYEKALAIQEELGDRRGMSVSLHSLAELDCLQGRYDAAREGYEEALAIQRKLGDRREVSATLHSLAELDRLQGRYDAAGEGLAQALAIQRELGDRRGVSVTLHSLAVLDRLQGRYDAARDGSEQSLAIARELGERSGISANLYGLAQLDFLQGRYVRARDGLQKCLAIARELGHQSGVSGSLHSLAELDRLQGRYDAAREGYQKALAIKEELGDPHGIAVTALYLEAVRAQADPALSLTMLRNAAEAARTSPDPLVGARSYWLLGQVLRQRGALAEAREELTAGIEQAEHHGYRGSVADMQAELALALAEMGEAAAAAEAARKAMAFFDEQDVMHPHRARLEEIAAAAQPPSES